MNVDGESSEEHIKTFPSTVRPSSKRYFVKPNAFASKIPLDPEPHMRIHEVFYRYCDFNCYFCHATKKSPKAFDISDPELVKRCLQL